MALYQDLTQMLQGEANVGDTQALTAERWMQVALGQQQLKERQATQSAMATALKGPPIVDPSMAASPDDTPIMAARKDIARERRESEQYSATAKALAAAGGSAELTQKYIKDSMDAANRASQAQKRLVDEQKNLSLQIGGIAGTANTIDKSDNIPDAAQRIKALDPVLYKSLAWDKDQLGNPIAGPTSQRTMDTLYNASMTAAQQQDRQIKAADELRKEKNEERLERATDAQVELRNAEAARARAGVASPKPSPEETMRQKGIQKIIDAGETEPKSWDLGHAAQAVRQMVKTNYSDAKLDDNFVQDMAKDVAAKTLEIRADNARHLTAGQDPISLTEARKQAIAELSNFVHDKTIPGSLPGGWFDKKVKVYEPGDAGPVSVPAKDVAPARAAVGKITTAEAPVDYLEKNGVKVQGRGTDAAPYMPVTQAEVDAIPAGAMFMVGTQRYKKK